MAQVLVRNIENQIKIRLQKQARRHGRSMEAEAREILRDALKEEECSTGLGTEIAGLFQGIGLEKEIPELRGHAVKPASFRP